MDKAKGNFFFLNNSLSFIFTLRPRAHFADLITFTATAFNIQNESVYPFLNIIDLTSIRILHLSHVKQKLNLILLLKIEPCVHSFQLLSFS